MKAITFQLSRFCPDAFVSASLLHSMKRRTWIFGELFHIEAPNFFRFRHDFIWKGWVLSRNQTIAQLFQTMWQKHVQKFILEVKKKLHSFMEKSRCHWYLVIAFVSWKLATVWRVMPWFASWSFIHAVTLFTCRLFTAPASYIFCPFPVHRKITNGYENRVKSLVGCGLFTRLQVGVKRKTRYFAERARAGEQ